MLITCQVDEFPCQPANQAQVVEPSLDDFAALGLTPASVATSIGFGFGIVLALGLVPLVAGAIIKLIRGM